MTEEEISRVLADMGQPAFRGKQVFTWLHRGVRSFDEMSNLSKSLRQQLAQDYTISVPTVARKQESRLDGTIKYLWELPDGNCIETVLMQYHHGNTVCISSQVGCRMGCAFCASTVAGKVRDLTAGEMLDQVLFTQLDSGREISNIVLMGIGEPLDNRENVLRFLRLVNHPDGLNIGMRHISLSTCGVVPGIDALAEEDLQLTLSVSLHAPDSETRSRIMPVNRAWDVEELFAACHRYFRRTGRRISFEYAMIDGVNDHDWQADLIAKRIAGMPGHVNRRSRSTTWWKVPSSPAAVWPRFRSGWSHMASPPRCGGVWVGTSTPPAASCAAALWRKERGVIPREALEDHRSRPGAPGKSGCLWFCPAVRRLYRGCGVRRHGRCGRGQHRQQRSGGDVYPHPVRLRPPGPGGACRCNGSQQRYPTTGCRTSGAEKHGHYAGICPGQGRSGTHQQCGRQPGLSGRSSGPAADQPGPFPGRGHGGKGDLTPGQARSHPRRNLITRALGPDPAVEADDFAIQWKAGDFLLLCSDGLVNTVTDQEIMFEILHNGQPEDCLQRLMAISKQRGAPDNVTAILLMND